MGRRAPVSPRTQTPFPSPQFQGQFQEQFQELMRRANESQIAREIEMESGTASRLVSIHFTTECDAGRAVAVGRTRALHRGFYENLMRAQLRAQ
jgi:hypothetical protein